MTKDTDKQQESKRPDGIDFEKAQNMTVGEAARAEADMKAGITEKDGILDRYIKQHRDEVVAEKFDTKVAELEQLDTASLDAFIEKKKQELQELEEIETQNQKEEQQSLDAEEVKTTIESRPVIDEIELSPVEKREEKNSEIAQEVGFLSEESFVEKSNPKRMRRIVWGVLTVAVLAIIAFCFTWFSHNKKQSPTNVNKSLTVKTSKSSTTTSAKAAKEANSVFTKAYDAFFTDSTQTALKNSQFDQLSDLQTKLAALKNTSYYKAAKSKYDRLEAQIKAIQAVNDKFDSAKVVDGSQTDAAVKSDANFDDLDSKTLNTGNSTLDKVLQAAVTEGRGQLASGQETSVTTTAPSQAQTATDSNQVLNAQEVSAATSYGITNYDPAILQRDRSRVPYDFGKIADSTNPAWTFNAGVLEKILEISRQRGYITGNNFILERVNIINGNGYYNMFKPDGTYLFSINAKTGYFVGNAPGHSDALDY
ncbi:cell division site-positioning protein MapZ family protein [Streptococcus sciuri]|uniref:Mid-cell-anchored protein Z n=1 Tax=Streptococcus sciuri TaxID=2973939 RepID=A0ABT2F7Y5_9STRE|nr:cell division site-positioning protein MapZ family protein [Streptococcus sciuri]MCS4488605.1 cell division site-positioning protein MapZ family protein [Streptococcus sciuri]